MSANGWTCARTDTHLDEALMGELGPLQQRAFGRHRQDCPRCRAVIAEAVETVGLLRSWPLETPGPDFTARVLAARTAPVAAPSGVWVRYAQAMVVSAVGCMVLLVSLAGVVWPGFWDAPGEHLVAAAGGLAQGLQSVIILATTTASALGPAVWAGVAVGLVAFYGAAFAGLRRFLVRRPL